MRWDSLWILNRETQMWFWGENSGWIAKDGRYNREAMHNQSKMAWVRAKWVSCDTGEGTLNNFDLDVEGNFLGIRSSSLLASYPTIII